MKKKILEEEQARLIAPNNSHCVSIIMPFEPKMAIKDELERHLQEVIEKAEENLFKKRPLAEVRRIMKKLKSLFEKLDYSTHKQSAAIFVSYDFEKIYYLDFPVEEKIIVDETFEMRDLVYCKKDIHKYLVLVLNRKKSCIYLGNTNHFLSILINTSDNIEALKNDLSSRVANFSDTSDMKEDFLYKFLRQIDNSLGIVLNAYKMPLFIMGSSSIVGHFKKITHYNERIIDFVHGNFEEASENEIRAAIAPHVADWKRIRQDDLLIQIDTARSARKLAVGIHEVWKKAIEKRGRLLLVEKNYIYTNQKKEMEQMAPETEYNPDRPFYIKDVVDEIIEKVLRNGGDVEFVDERVLENYEHIALMQFY